MKKTHVWLLLLEKALKIRETPRWNGRDFSILYYEQGDRGVTPILRDRFAGGQQRSASTGVTPVSSCTRQPLSFSSDLSPLRHHPSVMLLVNPTKVKNGKVPYCLLDERSLIRLLWEVKHMDN